MKCFKGRILHFLSEIHWLLILNVLILFSIGIAVQYSSSGGTWKPYAVRQIWVFSLFSLFNLGLTQIKIERLFNILYIVYFVSIVLLLLVEIFGSSVMGATRWLRIGGFNFQPSELCKVTLILALSRYVHECSVRKLHTTAAFLIALAMVMLPVVLILKQPNLGTAIITIIIAGIILFTTTTKRTYLICCAVLLLFSIPLGWTFLHDYQKNRILIFLHSEEDPSGLGYNIMQSQIAIGSGGMFGKGFMNGKQTQRNFLPEKRTDFAFTVLSEEWGFFGAMFFFAIYLNMVRMILRIITKSDRHFCKSVILGITAFFCVHFIMNIGMVTAVLPVMGVPLPFISYGGTITMTSTICIGIALMIHADNCRKQKTKDLCVAEAC